MNLVLVYIINTQNDYYNNALHHNPGKDRYSQSQPWIVVKGGPRAPVCTPESSSIYIYINILHLYQRHDFNMINSLHDPEWQ